MENITVKLGKDIKVGDEVVNTGRVIYADWRMNSALGRYMWCDFDTRRFSRAFREEDEVYVHVQKFILHREKPDTVNGVAID